MQTIEPWVLMMAAVCLAAFLVGYIFGYVLDHWRN
jgi:F0F1-type ATP synthase assembly protein I